MGRIRLDNNVFLPMPVGLLGEQVGNAWKDELLQGCEPVR